MYQFDVENELCEENFKCLFKVFDDVYDKVIFEDMKKVFLR